MKFCFKCHERSKHPRLAEYCLDEWLYLCDACYGFCRSKGVRQLDKKNVVREAALQLRMHFNSLFSIYEEEGELSVNYLRVLEDIIIPYMLALYAATADGPPHESGNSKLPTKELRAIENLLKYLEDY